MRIRTIAISAIAAWLGLAPILTGPAFADVNQIYELAAALANASVPIEITTATTTQLIAAPAGTEPGGLIQHIEVSAADVIADGAGNIKFVYGTGSNCGTNQGNITGNYNLTAQTGFTKGNGFGPVWILPAGNALCAVTSAAVGMHGSLSYRIK